MEIKDVIDRCSEALGMERIKDLPSHSIGLQIVDVENPKKYLFDFTNKTVTEVDIEVNNPRIAMTEAVFWGLVTHSLTNPFSYLRTPAITIRCGLTDYQLLCNFIKGVICV